MRAQKYRLVHRIESFDNLFYLHTDKKKVPLCILSSYISDLFLFKKLVVFRLLADHNRLHKMLKIKESH